MSRNSLSEGVDLSSDRFELLTEMMQESALVVKSSGEIVLCNPAGRLQYQISQADRLELPQRPQENGQILHANGHTQALAAPPRIQPVEWEGQPAFLVLLPERKDGHLPHPARQHHEERYHALMEMRPDPIYRYRADLSISYANLAACNLLGRTREELNGANLLTLVPARSREYIRRHIQSLLSQPQMRVSEQAFLTSTREIRWIEVTEQPLLDSRGQVTEIQAVGHEITARKLAEEALRDSELRYRALIEDSPAIICRFLQDGTLTYINETGCAYFGRDRAELIGFNIKALISPDRHIEVDRVLTSFTPDMDRKTLETEVIAAGGELRWTRWTARVMLDGEEHALEYQAVGVDTTESRQAVNVLRDSEQRFRELLENLHMIAVSIGLDSRLTFANAYFYNMTGYRPEDVLGKNYVELMVPPEERARVQDAFHQMMSSGKVIPYGENHIITRSGEQRLIGWNTTRMNNSQGELIGLASIGEDITERVWAQKMQAVVHSISQGAAGVARVEELYPLIHFSLSSLMPVDNFFISLYDAAKNEISFPYFIDQYDEAPAPASSGRGLTGYVLRTGRPLLASPEVFDQLVARGEVESVGVPSIDWMGVPLKAGQEIVGVMVVQSYTEGVRFGERDLQILDFVSTQAAMTIVRKRAEQALRENEEKYRALVEASNSAIFLETTPGQIIDCNQAACDMLGYSKSELLSLRVSDLVPDEVSRQIQQVIRLEEEHGGHHWETYNRHKNGSLIPVEVSSRRIEIGGQKLTVVYVDDITLRRRREREMEAIARVSGALRTAITQADILPVILDQLVSQLNVHGAFISLTEPDHSIARVELGCGTWDNLSGRPLPARDTVCKHVAATGKLYVNNEVAGDALFPFPERIDGVRAVASVPLIMQGNILGALTVGYERPIRNEEIHILTAISDIAASAIQRARLYEQTSRQAAELTEAYDATIEGWALALELRNKETEGHSRRVTELTLRLAAFMGVSETELINIRRGVLLHDIGKMGIPDSILLKPGPLTEEEWTVMRMHPEHAYRMLSTISYLHPALDIPYCHHEKWDGTGYPRKLKGEEIPFYARIFAVVDVIDAITSPRPYRSITCTLQEALAYIRQQAGHHFDPGVVDALLKMAKGNTRELAAH